MRVKQVQAKDVPMYVEQAEHWMSREGRDGATWMLSYMFGQLVDGVKEPDEISEMLARAQTRRCAASLRIADLYSVTPNKTLDVIEAAKELPENMEVRREFFDTDNGFMVFERAYNGVLYMPDVNDRQMESGQVQVCALSWRIFGNKIHIYGWTVADTYLKSVVKYAKHLEITKAELMQRIDNIGPLIICGEHLADMRDYMIRAKRLTAKYGRDSMSILLAATLMLKQEVTARSRIEVPQSLYRFGQKPDMNATRAVTIIDKRAIKANPSNEEHPEAPGKRQLTVRYDVRGHWRQYKDERFSPEVREHPIWIPAHWVGDESLPVVDRKKVTRLKR